MKLKKEYIVGKLKKDKSFLTGQMGIRNLALFGSYARNSQNENSDIDFLIDLNEINYQNLHSVFVYIKKKFPGKKIQLIRKGPHLSKEFLTSIENDLAYVW